MNFFRNPEIKRSLLLYLLLTAVAAAAALLFTNFRLPYGLRAYGYTGCLMILLLGLMFTLLHFIPTFLRYRRIRQLSRDIDRVLHGNDSLSFSDYSEGELSILKIEIDKMLLRMREQSEALSQEKLSLANSMADISHQIRTPLTSLHLVQSLLSEPELSDGRRMELVRQLSMLLSRIDWLIEALLKLSRLDAGTAEFKPQPLPAAQLIQKAAEPLMIPMELREQTFSFTAGNNREMLFCDLSWTTEAIGNILKNCMEHTPAGGAIRVRVQQNALFTEIIIEDNGPGFEKEDLPHIFERFYKGKHSGSQSIGIGLALARMILSQQDATIKAENRQSGGARFIIHFYAKCD